MVYEDAEKLYAEVRKEGEAVIEEAFGILFPTSSPLTASTPAKHLSASASPNDVEVAAYNTTFFPRREVVAVPMGAGPLAPGIGTKIVQVSEDGKTGYGVVDCMDGGSMGVLCAPGAAMHEFCMPVSGASALRFLLCVVGS